MAPWATTAVLTVIGAGGSDHDHFTLGLAQPFRLVHERIMVGKESSELIRTPGQRQKMGTKPDLSWQNQLADILTHPGFKAADGVITMQLL